MTTTVSALPEPFGFVRPRFSIDASFFASVWAAAGDKGGARAGALRGHDGDAESAATSIRDTAFMTSL